MTGVEYAISKFNIEKEKLLKKYCPGDFGICTEESAKCNYFVHFGACERCWNSEVIK